MFSLSILAADNRALTKGERKPYTANENDIHIHFQSNDSIKESQRLPARKRQPGADAAGSGEKTSMDFRIRHNIPGRLRLKITARGGLTAAQACCAALPGVRATRLNAACASLIVSYDAAQLRQEALLEAVSRCGGRDEAPAAGASSGLCASACSCAAPLPPSKARGHFLRFLGLTAVMAYVFVKEVLLKRALAQSLFSPLGLISIAASLPLFAESARHAWQKRFTLEGFLAAGCALASLSGQAVTALEILWIQSGAESLNAWITERSRRSVSGILDLTAKNTFILAGDVEVEMPVSGVRPRDIVVLHTGEKVCVDGEIVSGEALLDDSPITGRAEQAHARPGDKVFAGSYVRHGVIHVRAECVGDHTYLARIMRQVEDSLENKAPVEGVADRLARTLVRLGLIATAGTFLITASAWRAFTVMLVMACPCATALSAKTAVSAAMSAAAKRGILIKGGRYLEEVGKTEIVCFDKTGTLTTNEPRIERIMNFSGLPENELLLWAYSAEAHNHHPLAQAIKKEALARGIDPVPHTECDFTLGRGVRAVFGREVYRLGNRRYLLESGIAAGPEIRKAVAMRNKGLTVIFLARNETVLAAFGFANEARPDARYAIDALRESGVRKIAMITGDSKATALAFCREMAIGECHHSVLPEEKGLIVAGLRGNGHKVIMVGDGINDALALAEADIGIAMSAAGSDVAIEAADIALIKDDLADILYLRDLSRRTLGVATQNFWLATGTNIGGALLGALGILSPVAAGLIHIAHTLGVLANSSRLLLPEAGRTEPVPAGKT